MANRDIDEWLWHLGSELERLKSEGISSPPKVAKKSAWEPAIDLYETANYVVIKVEIAGVQTDNLKILIQQQEHKMILKGERFEENFKESRQKCHQLEISYGEFEREIELPAIPLNWDSMQAKYNNGFLLIFIPKDSKKIEALIIEKIFTLKTN